MWVHDLQRRRVKRKPHGFHRRRLTRTDAGHATYEVTVDDPKTYTRPWKNTRTFTLRTDWEILEYSCEENNKSLLDGRIKVPKYDGKN